MPTDNPYDVALAEEEYANRIRGIRRMETRGEMEVRTQAMISAMRIPASAATSWNGEVAYTYAVGGGAGGGSAGPDGVSGIGGAGGFSITYPAETFIPPEPPKPKKVPTDLDHRTREDMVIMND